MASVAELGIDIPFVKEIIVAIVGVTGFAYSCYKYGRRTGSKGDQAIIDRLREEKADLERRHDQSAAKLNELNRVVSDARDFWLRPPSETDFQRNQNAVYSSIPVLCVVNFKGGVGKTTICANIAAHFAEKGKRVLLIDCDYQGSLSDTVLTHARVDKFKANAQKLLEPDHNPQVLRSAAERLSGIDSRLWIYPAFYDFSRTEIRMMFRWLVGQDDEIRYNLSNYLQSAPFKDDTDTAFDMVLIDAPPRLLTGVVNSLTASTHVLIPTILDGQSHLATANTIAAIQQFRQKLNPALKILGVVPSMVSTASGYNARELEFLDELERKIAELGDGPVAVLKNRPIWRREELAKAGGSEILYGRDSNDAKTREIRAMFANLGDYIEQNVAWRRPGPPPDTIAVPGERVWRFAQ